MDSGIIIAISGATVAIVATVLAMMYWVRSESNDLRKDANADRKDFLMLLRGIQDEIKDFHYRLLEIEREKNR